MGAGRHGGFGATKGSRPSLKMDLQFFAARVFGEGGYLSKESFEDHREFFLGKSAEKIAKEMRKYGYDVEIKRSTHANSSAKRIIVKNPSKSRNISQILVSPGSDRHGGIAYVKISTTDLGRLKIISSKKDYKSDGTENAKIYYPRRFN